MIEDKIAAAMGLKPLSEVAQEETFDLVISEETLPKELSVEEDNQYLSDVSEAKENAKSVIEQASSAVSDLLAIAKQSQNAKEFETVATLMRTVLDANKDFVYMSEKEKYAKEEHPTTNKTTNVTNNNLILSTADLLKMMKGDK